MKAILTAIVSGTSLLALASVAQAQGAAPASESTTVPAPSTGAAQPVPPAQPETTPDATIVSDAAPEEPASDIVVTGSRIVRDGSRSPTPVTVLSTAQLVTSNPTSLSDALRDIPQLAGTSGVASGGTTSSSAQSLAWRADPIPISAGWDRRGRSSYRTASAYPRTGRKGWWIRTSCPSC